MTPGYFLVTAQRVISLAGVLTLLLFVLSNRPEIPSGIQESVVGEDDAVKIKGQIMVEERLLEAEHRLANRRSFLTQKCSEEGLDRPGSDSLHRPNAGEFLINRQHHLIWCNVFKAASTSWMWNFHLLAGYTQKFLKEYKGELWKLARESPYPRPTAEQLDDALKDSLSFLIVRHPFERTLSAYRNKLENSTPYSFHGKLGTRIAKQYRRKDASKNGHDSPTYPLFEEFVRWLLHEWKSGNELDMHWAPVANFCTPCQVRFDVILKFETLQDDQNFLIKQAHVEDIIKQEWKNPTHGTNTKDVMKSYFSQLSKSQIKELYEMYKYDFILFDYSPDDYFLIGKEDEEEMLPTN